jgi:hypothetical protein
VEWFLEVETLEVKNVSNRIDDRPGPFIESKEGKALQEEWREELWAKLESIKPGVTRL